MLKYWINVFIVFAGMSVYGQNASTDMGLLKTNDPENQQYKEYQPKYIFKDASAFVKYNPVSLLFGGLMYGYQKAVSPQISSNCMYHLSCSKFSVASIRKYGLLKGICLSADRLTRCNQISAIEIPEHRMHPKSKKVVDKLEWYGK